MDAKSEAVMKSDSSSSSKSIVQAETSSSSVRVCKKSISSKEIVATQLLSGTYKTFTDGIGSNVNETLQLANSAVASFPNETTLDGHMSDGLLADHRSQSISSAVRQSASIVSVSSSSKKHIVSSSTRSSSSSSSLLSSSKSSRSTEQSLMLSSGSEPNEDTEC